jgi:ABC-type glycerol-3-phosphate transport system substrate-binding protein
LLPASQVRSDAADTALGFPTWEAEEPGSCQWRKEPDVAFERAHAGVTIAWRQIAFPNFFNKMTVRFASNTLPDIVELSGNSFDSSTEQSSRFARSRPPGAHHTNTGSGTISRRMGRASGERQD